MVDEESSSKEATSKTQRALEQELQDLREQLDESEESRADLEEIKHKKRN